MVCEDDAGCCAVVGQSHLSAGGGEIGALTSKIYAILPADVENLIAGIEDLIPDIEILSTDDFA